MNLLRVREVCIVEWLLRNKYLLYMLHLYLRKDLQIWFKRVGLGDGVNP